MASGKFSTVTSSISAPTTRAPSVMFFSVVVPALVQSLGAVHVHQGRSIGESEVGLTHDLLAVVERGGSEVAADLRIPALGPGGTEQHVDFAGGEHVEALGRRWCPRTRPHWRHRARPRQEPGSSRRRIRCKEPSSWGSANRWPRLTRRIAGYRGPVSRPACRLGWVRTTTSSGWVVAAWVAAGSRLLGGCRGSGLVVGAARSDDHRKHHEQRYKPSESLVGPFPFSLLGWHRSPPAGLLAIKPPHAGVA